MKILLCSIDLKSTIKDFIIPFTSTLGGAYFGAWGAHKLSEKKSKIEEIKTAFQSVNSSIIIASHIANEALNIKKNNLIPLTKTYLENKKKASILNDLILNKEKFNYEDHKIKNYMTQPPTLKFPIDALKNQTLGNSSTPGKAVAIVLQLETTVASYLESTYIMKQQIEKLFQSTNSDIENLRFTYGLKNEKGIKNLMLHDSLLATKQYIDDIIFFSLLLIEDLNNYAKSIQEKIKKLTNETHQHHQTDFTQAYNLDLVPNKDEYTSWTESIK